jgi:hypothetical protein
MKNSIYSKGSASRTGFYSG